MYLVFRIAKALECILNVILIALQFWKKILFNLSIFEHIYVVLNALQLMYNILLCTCAKLKKRTLVFCEIFLLMLCTFYCALSYRIIADKENLNSVASAYWIEAGFTFVLFLVQLCLVLYTATKFKHLLRNSAEYEQRTIPSLSSSNCHSSESFSPSKSTAAFKNHNYIYEPCFPPLLEQIQDLSYNNESKNELEHSRNYSSSTPVLKKRSDNKILGFREISSPLMRQYSLEHQDREISFIEHINLPGTLQEATLDLATYKKYSSNESEQPRKFSFATPVLKKSDTKILEFPEIDSFLWKRANLEFKCSETLSDYEIEQNIESNREALLNDEIVHNTESNTEASSDNQIDQNMNMNKLTESSENILGLPSSSKYHNNNGIRRKKFNDNLNTTFGKYCNTNYASSAIENEEEMKELSAYENQISQQNQLFNRNTVINSHSQLNDYKRQFLFEKARTGNTVKRNNLPKTNYREEPSAKEPSAKESSAKVPSAKEPSAKEPSAKEPSAKEPSAKEPSAKEPSAKEPSAKESNAKKPSAKKPNNFQQDKSCNSDLDARYKLDVVQACKNNSKPEITNIQNESIPFIRDKDIDIISKRRITSNDFQHDEPSSDKLYAGYDTSTVLASTNNSIKGSNCNIQSTDMVNIYLKKRNLAKISKYDQTYSKKMSEEKLNYKKSLSKHEKELSPMICKELRTSKNILGKSNYTQNINFQHAKKYANVCHKVPEISNTGKSCIKENKTLVKTEYVHKRNSNVDKDSTQDVTISNNLLNKKFVKECDSLKESIFDMTGNKALKNGKSLFSVKKTSDDQKNYVENSERNDIKAESETTVYHNGNLATEKCETSKKALIENKSSINIKELVLNRRDEPIKNFFSVEKTSDEQNNYIENSERSDVKAGSDTTVHHNGNLPTSENSSVDNKIFKNMTELVLKREGKPIKTISLQERNCEDSNESSDILQASMQTYTFVQLQDDVNYAKKLSRNSCKLL